MPDQEFCRPVNALPSDELDRDAWRDRCIKAEKDLAAATEATEAIRRSRSHTERAHNEVSRELALTRESRDKFQAMHDRVFRRWDENRKASAALERCLEAVGRLADDWSTLDHDIAKTCADELRKALATGELPSDDRPQADEVPPHPDRTGSLRARVDDLARQIGTRHAEVLTRLEALEDWSAEPQRRPATSPEQGKAINDVLRAADLLVYTWHSEEDTTGDVGDDFEKVVQRWREAGGRPTVTR